MPDNPLNSSSNLSVNAPTVQSNENSSPFSGNLPFFTIAFTGSSVSETPSGNTGASPARIEPETSRIEDVRFYNPELARAISEVHQPTTGVSRDKIGVPLSPTTEVTDEILFEDPSDAAKKFYLPRYHFAEETVSGKLQAQIRLEASAQGARLSIGLEKYPSPEIAEAARGAQELPHKISVILKHKLAPDGSADARLELGFQELTETETGVRATLLLSNLNERDRVFQALTDSDYNATLIVRRAINVAIPVNPFSLTETVVSSGKAQIFKGKNLSLDIGNEAAVSADLLYSEESLSIVPQGEAQIARLNPNDLNLTNNTAFFEGIRRQHLKSPIISYSDQALPRKASILQNTLLQVTPYWGRNGVFNEHNVGVWQDKNNNRLITNLDGTPIPNNAAFFVEAQQPDSTVFKHTATAENILLNGTFLDHPAINQNPNALILVTTNLLGDSQSKNNHAIRVEYRESRGKWAIFNGELKSMAENSNFNVEILAPGESNFIHRVTRENRVGSWTYLDHPLLNFNQNALLLVTTNLNVLSLLNDPTGVWFDPSRRQWAIVFKKWNIKQQFVVIEELEFIPIGATFIVKILQTSQTAFIHFADNASISNGDTRLNPITLAENPTALRDGDVFAVKTNGGNYAKVQIEKQGTDSADFIELSWTTFQSEEAPLFRETTRVLDCVNERQPFVFPLALHPYIFRSVGNVSNQKFGLILRSAEWNGKPHIYLQDEARRDVFYYLPDSFKIARRPQVPRFPLMSVSFTSPDGKLSSTTATLNYFARPFVDTERLKAAAESLKKNLPEHSAASPQELTLEPFLESSARLRLGLPRANSANNEVFQERVGAIVNLRDGVSDQLTLPIDDFQKIYDAIYGGVSVVFNGQIEVNSDHATIPPIPFIGRLSDLHGEVLTYKAISDAAAGNVRATLTNAIESPVKINNLKAELRCGDAKIKARIEDVSFPIESLPPQQSITFVIAPLSPVECSEDLTAVFNLMDVEVLPDQEAIYDYIFNKNSPRDYFREIEVKTFREVFNSKPNRSETVRVILIELKSDDGGENSVTVELNSEKTIDKVELPRSYRSYFSGQTDDSKYLHRVTVFRGEDNPRPGTSGEWISDTKDLLFVLPDEHN